MNAVRRFRSDKAVSLRLEELGDDRNCGLGALLGDPVEVFKWVVGSACIFAGLAFILIATSSERSKLIPFDFWDLLVRGTHVEESSSMQLGIEGIAGVLLGVAVILLL